MKVDSFVTTSTETRDMTKGLASTERTDAVNSHIVQSADKSGMALKGDPLRREMENGTIASVEQKTVGGRVIDTKYHSTSGTIYDSAGNAVGSTKETGSVKSLGGAKAQDAARRSSKLKKLGGNAAQAAHELDGDLDETSGKIVTDNAAKLGNKAVRKGSRFVSESMRKGAKAGEHAGKKVVQKTGDRISSLAERRYRKTGPADAMHRMQSAMNQGKSRAIAQKAASSIASKASAAIGNFVGAMAGAVGGVLGVLGGIVALLAPGIIIVAVIAAIIGGGQEQNAGSLTGVEAEVATTLQSYGFTNESIAAILGNFAAESGDYGAINPDVDEDDGYGTRSVGMMQMTGSEITYFFNWCNANNKQWNSAAVQIEWCFSGEPGTEHGYYATRWTSWGWQTYFRGGRSYETYYCLDSGYESRFKVDCAHSGDAFKGMTDVNAATYSWMGCYERPGSRITYSTDVSHLDHRIDYANRYLTALNSGGGEAAPPNSNEIVSRAYAELGKPYSWGAVGPSSYDCSGLVSYCLTGRHSRLGTTNTFMGWHRLNPADAVPGDVVTNDHHCGIYIGGGKMIHSPQTGDVVKISNVHSGMIYVRYGG